MSIIVVTGGTGFLGSNLLAALEAREGGRCDLVVCDTLGSADKWRNVAKRDLADIVAPARLIEFLAAHERQVETIFHLGANSSTTARDVDAVIEGNFRFSMALWSWCADHHKRFIHASSAATYGDGSAGFDDDGRPAALAKLRPLNPYGWSKHLVDRRIARLVAANRPHPRQWAGLKFFNVYGPNEYHKGPQRSVALQLFQQAIQGQPVRLFRSHDPKVGDGEQKRDFVWVDDCIDVMLWLLDHPGVSGLFNVGSGTARSFLDLARAVFASMGQAPRIEFIDTPSDIRAHYQYFTQARLERLRAAGYDRRFTALEDGIARYVRDSLMTSDPHR